MRSYDVVHDGFMNNCSGVYDTTEATKKKIWPNGLLAESKYELRLVACISTGALVKGGSWSKVPTQVEVAAYRSNLFRTSNQVVGSNPTSGIKSSGSRQQKFLVLRFFDVKEQQGIDRFYNGKLVQTLLEGHSTLSLEGSISGDCDVEKIDLGMLDKFDRGLQTDVQVFMDFDYAIVKSITSGVHDTTEATKKKIWPNGLLAESKYELRLVAGISTGALVKGGSWSKVPTQVEFVAYRY
nr:zinc finger, CCHC-type [Tanacetum cinerariifolium]